MSLSLNTSNTSRFGQRVRQLRLAKGWDPEKLAEQMGWNARRVTQLERSQLTDLSPAVIERLAELLETDVDELFVLAGRLPPCLAWVQVDPSVAKLLGALVALIDSRVTLSERAGGQSHRD